MLYLTFADIPMGQVVDLQDLASTEPLFLTPAGSWNRMRPFTLQMTEWFLSSINSTRAS